MFECVRVCLHSNRFAQQFTIQRLLAKLLKVTNAVPFNIFEELKIMEGLSNKLKGMIGPVHYLLLQSQEKA